MRAGRRAESLMDKIHVCRQVPATQCEDAASNQGHMDGWRAIRGLMSMLVFVICLVLIALCWPLAVLALILWPIMWLVSIPLRLLGFAVGGVFRLLRAILLLPVRILEAGQQI
jgi:hypothetical protein